MNEEKTYEVLPINSVNDIATIGDAIAKSGMFGSCTSGKGAVIAAICHQRRMDLLTFKLSFHVTDKGDVSMRSDRMLAEFMRRGGKCKWLSYTGEKAAAVFSFGENQNLEMAYSIDEAKAAGYIKKGSAWETSPADMLRARLISKAVRMICPEVVAGIYTPEELDEINPSQDDRRKPKRVAGVEVSQSPARVEIIDFEVCPIPGKMYGKMWADMEIEVLEAALSITAPEMTEGHRDAIQDELAARTSGGDV